MEPKNPGKIKSKRETKSNSSPFIAGTASGPDPLEGQSARSGNNFSTNYGSDNVTTLKVVVLGNPNADRIKFDLKLDKTAAKDSTWQSGIGNGSTFGYESHTKVYVANPTNAGGTSFSVQLVSA